MTPRSDFQYDAFIAPDEIIVDSFAGGGGASLGISWALGRGPHIAINHDREAIALHAANHPETEHFPEDVWEVDPVVACAGRKVGLMWLSPDCKHFSKAKGGKPVSKKIRGLAWTACRWAKAVRPRVIVLENVSEFQTWGPVDRATNRPDPARKGITFNRFIGRLRRLGYQIEWRELRACDYGAPTIRQRLFIIARCDGKPIVWPKATHGKGRALPWRTAAECIDWTIPCPSIFERTKPLAENTQRRIARGVYRYVINSPKPFIVQYHSAKRAGDDRIASVEAPLGTLTAENRFGLVAPVLAGVGGRAGQSPERRLDQPYQTITAKADAALVVPVIEGLGHARSVCPCGFPMWAKHNHCPQCLRPLDDRVTAPVMVPMQHANRPTSVEAPLDTITTQHNKLNIVAPVLVPTTHDGDARAHSVEEPARTITGAHRGEHALIAPTLIQTGYGEDKHRNSGAGQPPRSLDIEAPLGTVVSGGVKHALVSSFLAKHQSERHDGEVQASALDVSMPTVKTRDSTALVTSNLVSLRGTEESHLHGDSIADPMRTIAAGGWHHAEVRAFLMAYYGNEKEGGSLNDPVRTITSHDRFGLVTIEGVEYAIADIGMRMLAPRELYRAQGFPDSYRIEAEIEKTVYRTVKTVEVVNGKRVVRKERVPIRTIRVPLTKTAQVRMCGNSVCPPLAAAIVSANLARETFTQAVA